MDRNLFIAIALSFLILSVWTMTQPPPPERTPGAATPTTEAPVPTTTATEPAPAYPAAPGSPAPVPVEQLPFTPDPVLAEGDRIVIATDYYTAILTTRGAAIERWELVKFNEGPRRGHLPIVLTTGRAPLQDVMITPLRELDRGDLSRELFTVESQDAESVVFRLHRDGVTVRKAYTFAKDSYEFHLRIEVTNDSVAPVSTEFGVGWPASVNDAPDFAEQALVALHQGSVESEVLSGFGQPGFFDSFTGDKPVRRLDFDGDVDWVGVGTSYFLSAVLPDAPSQARARFYVVEPGVKGVAEVSFPSVQIPSGQTLAREFRGYAGPKEVERLEALGAQTIRSIDLGWSWVGPLTRAFTWLLVRLESIIGNYGWSIIILTILVRVVTAPLTTKQMRSMERMRRLQPKLKELQEKHKDDREAQSREMMALYKREKVNPLGGCFPMLLQLPVFIGLFYALRSAIQLRQAEFILWIDDLSQPETLFVIPGLDLPVRVLPLIMGATMVLQSKIMPTQADPAQARMMMTVMPIMMTVLFYQFPSGLVLYWMVSNVVAISHQLLIGRRMRAATG